METDINQLLNKSELIYIRQSKFSEEEWHSSLHSHYFTEILIVLNGEGGFVVGNHELSIKKNDVIIVNPYIEHTETSSSKLPLWYVVIGINNIRFEKENEEINDFFIFRDFSIELVALLKLSINELNRLDWGHEAALVRLAEMIVITIYRNQKFRLLPVFNKSVSKDSVMIKEFLNNNFKIPLTLELIAEKVHLDKYYIIHTFKQNFDTTPMNYIMSKKIENAKSLLENTDYQVSVIAEINGFASQSYFNQAFKKKLGLSPLEYRKKCRLSK
ncbi:helix-turn-helix transcriptional regulator [Vagococcus fluvialis]|uniref:helix-turn-helix transcriptional regulator n=1 Tax=Vagococcus fluvialis TaxID=2738 RepID=UPI001A8C7937|nr:AraC family transcriptional regulator [Vagococcus fluvialis]MBO0436671.1 AraC family transcriptional regulator [Vagococcus fluvialis]